jgi:hypothetical protein
MKVPPNKAIVGDNAFSHSSGIHVDGFLKERETYEIMRPEDVGLSESRVVLTARTGRHGLRDRLKKLGYTLSDQELNQAYDRFLAVADKKQEVFDEDLVAILHDELHPLPELYQLDYLHIYSGTAAIPTATVRLRAERRACARALPLETARWTPSARPSRRSPAERPPNSETVRDSRRDQRHRSPGRGHHAGGRTRGEKW